MSPAPTIDCPDCGGRVTGGLIYGQSDEPKPCRICWECGWQIPQVYRRTRAERNQDYMVTGQCLGCPGLVVARTRNLLPPYCGDCETSRIALQRTPA